MFAKNKPYLYLISFILVLLANIQSSRASHIFGVDLYYHHASGNTYTVYLAVYGDCSGTAFSTLPSSVPVIEVYNGSSHISTLRLSIQSPASGVEVTPVCPAQASNTTCTNVSNPLPGIKKFLYAANVTLPYTASCWRFVFGSGMGGASTAGRSGSITNITFGSSGSPIELVDTLDNSVAPNSSPDLTSIPTPFFCISSPSNYNPAAVDPDGDHLSFSLVPGIESSTGSSVNYIYPYSATAPLATASGTFSFSSSTGQLSFTPNLTQKSLVVYNVRETDSAGNFKGTSQREMTVVVLSSCTNTPPTGAMGLSTAGTITSGTQFDICNSSDSFSFHIDPTDAEGDSITMTTSGLPSGATFTIAGNGSRSPHSIFHWSTVGVTPGSYTFYITYQDNGCPLVGRQTIAYTVNILPTPGEIVNIISLPTCLSSAVVQYTPTGTFSPFTINVMAGSVTVHSFGSVTSTVTDALPSGTYTIRIYNPDHCFYDTTINLPAPSLPHAVIRATAPTCPGGSTGGMTVTGSSGTSPYTYTIGSGGSSSSGTFTGLAPGVYTVHIRDANGCQLDTLVTVPDAAATWVNFQITKPLCDAQSNGVIILHASHSVAPYTFAMGSGVYSATDTFSSVAAGTYNFHVKNGNGCILDTVITLRDSLRLGTHLSISPILCNGGTGVVSLTGASGYPGYIYAVDTATPSAVHVFTLHSGTYGLHITDTQSCHFDTSITLTQPTPVNIAAALHNPGCSGAAAGYLIVYASGGTPGYLYAVDTGSYRLNDTLTGLPAGTHYIWVKDANGCAYADTVRLTQPPALVIDSVIAVQPSCFGGANGTIQLYVSGGVPGYTYALNAGGYTSSATFTGLVAMADTMHVQDAHGCLTDTIITLGQPTPLNDSISITMPWCNTLHNGDVELAATGGTPGYWFAIGSGGYSPSGSFTGLPSGRFIFHIRDANRCQIDTTLNIVNRLNVTGVFAINQPTCFGYSDGSFTVTGTGGFSPYTYAVDTSTWGIVNTFTGLASGAYLVHIQDSIGCIEDTAFNLLQPAHLFPIVTITEPLCHGDANGRLNVNASGGTLPYTYALNTSSFAFTVVYAGLMAGPDTVGVRDSHGCLSDTVLVIPEPDALVIRGLAPTNISCYDGTDGKVAVYVTGGTLPYQYAADGGAYQTSNIITGLSAGTHTIQVKDFNGCMTAATITLTAPQPLQFTGAAITGPTCEGYKDGAVLLYAAGGTTPYTYSMDNMLFSTSGAFTGLPEGGYIFIVRDNKGCIADTVIQLTGYPHIKLDSIETTLLCHGDRAGAVSLFASGGIPPLSYQWDGNPPQTAPNQFRPVNFGQGTIIITDSKHCRKDTVIDLREPDTLVINPIVTPNDCTGPENNGFILAETHGGTRPYRYTWTDDTTTMPFLMGMKNGLYTVTVTDSHACQDSATVKIGFNDCCIPFIPKAFTPNGDGHNDVFRIMYRGDIRIIVFEIFNRFGERVFVREYSEEGWDGNFHGVQAETGVYYYYIRLICGNQHNQLIEFKGDVTLIR